ncbi:MAG: hypothetical protein KBT88_03605 [Gammaproteobacteria bacterium]|nr:hypothetical protein [Gammaproteobacteria bacterium]MBQ0838847.1 hypothetical protein [Gammaproteobacteria bacterium]
MIASPVDVELCQPDSRFFDYCLWEYPPRVDTQGKWHSSNLLFQSFAATGMAATLMPVCDAIRRAIGSNSTVWGIKYAEGKISWEFYFYDYERLERRVSLTALLEALKPFASCELSYCEERPYFMFSIDLDESWAEPNKALDEVNIYVGNIGSQVSSGMSYSLTPSGLNFDNLYYFFDAQSEYEIAQGKLACSAHLDLPKLALDDILWPQMRDCEVLVVANKRQCDGVYFSRVGVEHLLWFMRKMAFPLSLLNYVDANRQYLDHLLFDVGVDYRMQNGEIQLLKSAYYGVF